MRREEQLSRAREYWQAEWSAQPPEEYQSYLIGHIHAKPWFLEAFDEIDVARVCDAACGFGAYSAMLSANGFQVSGFDTAPAAVELTCALLQSNALQYDQFIESDISDIQFPDHAFDATVAHAVLDHLPVSSAAKAVSELFRITKNGGLVYLSFDPLEEDDLSEPHVLNEDGSFLYTEGARRGLLFRFYTSDDIKQLLIPYQILQWRANRRGEREILLLAT